MATEKSHRGHQVRVKTADPACRTAAADLRSRVAARAHEISAARRSSTGSDFDDWLSAEAEICGRLPIEVLEMKDRLVVHADVPGVAAKDLVVTVDDRVLRVSGERRERKVTSRGSRHVTETRYGTLFREITLPAVIDTKGAAATLESGCLTVTLPKARPKKTARGTEASAEA